MSTSTNGGEVTGTFEGTFSDSTPNQSSYSQYIIEIDTSGNTESHNATNYTYADLDLDSTFTLEAPLPASTTTVWARAVEYVEATGNYASGDWQQFYIHDGVTSNTPPTIINLTATASEYWWESEEWTLDGSIEDGTPSNLYGVDIDLDADGVADTTVEELMLGTFSFGVTIPAGTTEVHVRPIEHIEGESSPVYGDWVLLTLPNREPQAFDDTFTMIHDTVGFPEYTLVDLGYDPDDDSLTVATVAGQDGIVVDVEGTTTLTLYSSDDISIVAGELSVEADGTYQFTAAAGFLGGTWFDFTLTDGPANSNSARITIEVTNTPPEAGYHEFVIPDNSIDLVTNNVTQLATDQDQDALTLVSFEILGQSMYFASQIPADGVTIEVYDDYEPTELAGLMTLFSDGTFEFSPEATFTGEFQFLFTITDSLTEDTGTITLAAQAAANADADVVKVFNGYEARVIELRQAQSDARNETDSKKKLAMNKEVREFLESISVSFEWKNFANHPQWGGNGETAQQNRKNAEWDFLQALGRMADQGGLTGKIGQMILRGLRHDSQRRDETTIVFDPTHTGTPQVTRVHNRLTVNPDFAENGFLPPSLPPGVEITTDDGPASSDVIFYILLSHEFGHFNDGLKLQDPRYAPTPFGTVVLLENLIRDEHGVNRREQYNAQEPKIVWGTDFHNSVYWYGQNGPTKREFADYVTLVLIDTYGIDTDTAQPYLRSHFKRKEDNIHQEYMRLYRWANYQVPPLVDPNNSGPKTDEHWFSTPPAPAAT